MTVIQESGNYRVLHVLGAYVVQAATGPSDWADLPDYRFSHDDSREQTRAACAAATGVCAWLAATS